MDTQTQAVDDREKPKDVEIRVNRQPVLMPTHEATGLQIKETAISQGVNIQLDFLLSKKGHHHIIQDGDAVKLHKDEQFSAVAPDDNS
jgi:Multiubiquitin